MLTTTALDGEYTLADWEAMPDDGRRYELIGGTITVSPPPAPGHQIASVNLEQLLVAAVPPGHVMLHAPIGLRLPGEQMVQPDIVVVPRSSIGPKCLTPPVLLVVEVVSPGSRTHDRVTKRAAYAAAGIEHYWLVDGTAARRRFTALRLAAGGDGYETALDTTGRVEVTEPLALSFRVIDLFRPPP
jgi:Uma2 family endonuclease